MRAQAALVVPNQFLGREPSCTLNIAAFDLPNVSHLVPGARANLADRLQYIFSRFSPAVTWQDAERMIAEWEGPFAVKGILSPEDAQLAVSIGASAIIVSNHGGRQLDHSEGSVGLVREISEAVGKQATIIVDGCILRGTDVCKALALGADAVAIGRLQGIGLAAGGAEAVVNLLEILETEMRSCMGLLGVRSLAELGPGHLAEVEPLGDRTWLESAFPLLAEGYGASDLTGLSMRLPEGA